MKHLKVPFAVILLYIFVDISFFGNSDQNTRLPASTPKGVENDYQVIYPEDTNKPKFSSALKKVEEKIEKEKEQNRKKETGEESDRYQQERKYEALASSPLETNNQYSELDAYTPSLPDLIARGEDETTSASSRSDKPEFVTTASHKAPVELNNDEDNSSSASVSGPSQNTQYTPENNPPKLYGKIPPLALLVADSGKSYMAAYAALCINPRIKLFEIGTMTLLADNPLSFAEIDNTASYTFSPVELNLDLENPTKYLLRAEGCPTETIERIVTNFNEAQDLTISTTVIAKVVNSVIVKDQPIQQVDGKDIDKLVKELEEQAAASGATTVKDTYNQLNEPSFKEVFPDKTPQLLLNSLPTISQLAIPSAIDEKVEQIFSAVAEHWSGADYTIAYEWDIDGTIYNGSSVSITPPANSKALLPVTLRIGKDDGAGKLLKTNPDIPYHQIAYNIIVNDTITATPPAWSLDATSTNPTATRDIILNLATGMTFEHCESLSALAITEDTQYPIASDFSITCDTANIQQVHYTLNSPLDGNINLKLWARDINGRISSTPNEYLVNLDTTAPALEFIAFENYYLGNRDATFKWKLTEVNSSNTQNFTLSFYDGTTWNALPNIALTDGPHNESIFETSFTLPGLNTTSAKLRLSYTDTLGHNTTVESSSIEIRVPTFSFLPAVYDFGSHLSQTESSEQAFTFTNTGAVLASQCLTPQLSGVNQSDFTIVSTSCLGQDLAPAESCSVLVKSTPQTKGSKTASLSLSCDGNSETISLSAFALNNLPVSAINQSYSTTEDLFVDFTVLAASDIDGDTLTYTVVTPPTHGTLSNCLQANGALNCRYQPNPDYNGDDSFSYQVNDGTSNALTPSVVTLSITPTNDRPVMIGNQSVTLSEDQSIAVTLSGATDIDLPAQELQYKVINPPTKGTLQNCIATTSYGTDLTCDYVANANETGTDSFTYLANDGVEDSLTLATVTINITPVNDAPTLASGQTLSANEDTALSFALSSGADIDLDPLTFIIVTPPLHGNLSCSGGTDPSCVYTPDLNFNGADTFSYKVSDGNLDSLSVSVGITVTAVNDAPTVPVSQTLSTNEDTSFTFNLNPGSDVDGDTLSYTITQQPAEGVLNCTAGSSTECTYTPLANSTTSVSFQYTVSDASLTSNSAVVTINISAVNDSPVMVGDQTETPIEDTAYSFSLSGATDIDLPGDTISYKIITPPAHGSITGCITTSAWSTDISCTYTPDLNYNGADSFTYRANDGLSDAATIATVYLHIAPGNDAPTVSPTQSVAATEDTIVNFDLNQGSDIDGDALSYIIVAPPSSGTLSCAGGLNRTCNYTPQANANGDVSFTYKVNDGAQDSAVSTVTISIAPVNDAPIKPVDQAVTAIEDTTLNFTLLSGTDLETASASLQYKLITEPLFGTLTNCISTGGYTTDISCSYTPSSNYHGVDSLSYITYDGQLESIGVTTVVITVTAVNDAPTIPPTQSVLASEDVQLSFDLNEGVDIEGDSLNYIIVTPPTSGGLTCSGGSSTSCQYLSAADYNGDISFSYKVNDGSLDSNIATVTITVAPVNDAPLNATNQAVTTDEDTELLFTLAEASDIDTPLASLQYKLVSAPSHGTLTACITDAAYSSDRSCSYTPDANFHGVDSFSYIVNDGSLDASGETTVTITVNPINDAPQMLLDQSESTRDDTDYTFTLNGAIDIDLPAQVISYKLVSAPTNGTLSNCITTGSYTTSINCSYRANANFHGTDSFTYLANDGIADSATVSTVTISVTDLTPTPAPTLTIEGSYYKNTNAIQLTVGSCSDIASILINTGSTPTGAEAQWSACSTVAGNYSFSTTTANQVHTLHVWAKDSHGNISTYSQTANYIFDNIAPAISFKPKTQYAAGSSQLIEWYMSEANSSTAQNIQLRFHDGTSWSILPAVASKNGPLSTTYFSTFFTTPAIDGLSGIIELSYTDLAGNSATVQNNIQIDGVAPVITSLDLNSGATLASNNNLSISISASDSGSKITSLCFKYNNTTAPSSTDSCWFTLLSDLQSTAVNIGPSDNIYFRVGFSFGTYVVSAWVRDEAGNISSYTDTLGVDKKSIDYNPGTPPEVKNVIAVNNDNPSTPLSYSDLSFSVGQSVIVKWHASDAEGLLAAPISLYYTIDNTNFTQIATGISNTQGAGCTIDANYTGCYVWVAGAPTTAEFKVRVVAEDTSNITSIAISPPTNQVSLSVIAGNTEKGIGGSAASAIFDVATSTYETDRNALVVANDGTVFFRDRNGNLLYVDPATGNLDYFIPTTGTSSGDGGSIALATLKEARAINLDHQGRLLIWDSNLIRRVNLSATPPTIETIIGGGVSDAPGSSVPANGIALDAYDYWYGTFIPLPNGDIYFKSDSSENSNIYRVYRESTGLVEEILTQGPGIYGYESEDWSMSKAKMLSLAYDPATSAITHMHVVRDRAVIGNTLHRVARLDFASGSPTTPYQAVGPFDIYAGYRYRSSVQLDGNIYFLAISGSRIKRYHPETNTYTNILGTESVAPAPCADGTAAMSCSVRVQSYFMTRQGKLYFVDRGLIRTLDENGNVITLMGQFKSSGDGGNALSARIGGLLTLDFGDSYDKIIFGDYIGGNYREVTIGGTIEHITSGTSTTQYNIVVDPLTGDIIDGTGGAVRRFIRATNTWTNVVGGGATDYTLADGLTGNNISFNWYTAQILGYDGTNFMVHKSRWDGDSSSDAFIKLYDSTDSYRQYQFMGQVGDTLNYPVVTSDSTVSTTISYGGFAGAHWNSYHSRWLIGSNWSYDNIIWAIPQAGGTIEQFAALPRGKDGFGIRQDGANTFIYYCNGGRLWEYDQVASTERKLDWNSGIACLSGNNRILYHPTRHSIIFIYVENNLYGIAEYKL